MFLESYMAKFRCLESQWSPGIRGTRKMGWDLSLLSCLFIFISALKPSNFEASLKMSCKSCYAVFLDLKNDNGNVAGNF